MRPLCVLILCSLVSGCAYQAILRSDSPPADFARSNRAFRSLHCQVRRPDTTFEGQSAVHFGSDTIRWNDPVTGQTRQAPFHDICSVKANNHKRGVLPGALIGLLVGTVVGSAAGSAHVKNTQSGEGMDFGDIGGGIALGFGIGTSCTILGMIIGHAVGAPVAVYNDAYLDINSPLRNR
jgi:hypothetical protein